MIRCILTKYLNDYIYIHISIYYIYVYMRITPSYDCMKLKKKLSFSGCFSQTYVSKARFRRRSTHVLNLIDELSPAKERRLNQFGTAVLIRCGNVVKFDKVCRII